MKPTPERDWLSEIDDCYANQDAADNLLRALAIEMHATLAASQERVRELENKVTLMTAERDAVWSELRGLMPHWAG